VTGGGARRIGSGAAAACYIVAALALTWPLAAHPFTRLAAPIGPGDPYLNLWILGWDLRAITHDPLALVTGRVFDANIFFPAAGTLAYSDHLILQAVAVWPVWLLTGNLTACYNALLVLSLVASALAMFAYAREVSGSTAGALVAGLAWGFLPFRFAHLLHLQLQSLYFLPLALLFLHRLVAARRTRDAVWLGVTAGLQAVSSVYWGVATGLALVAAAIALAIGVGRWRSIPLLRKLVLAALVGILVAAPFTWPYWVVQQREGFGRNLYEASQHEAVAASYLRAAPGNMLYGRTGLLRPAPTGESRHEGPEQELFPGFVLAALAGYGFVRAWRRDARPLALAMAAVGVAGFVISLGPDGFRTGYALLHRFVFGFQAVRAPARFGVLVGLSLAVMAAVGVREVVAGGGRLLAVLLAGAVALEFVNVPLPTVAAPPTSSAAARWLRDVPGPGAVVYMPLDGDLGNTPAMLDSLGHGRRIVNGYSGQRPSFFMAMVDTLARVPSAEALWTLRDLGVRFLVSASALPPAAPLAARGAFDGQWIYELVWTPEAEAALPRPEAPPPPVPGPVPFANAERAEYRVMWLTPAALGVAAGSARVTAETASGQPGYRVALEVETADWVNKFFEARDRFETSTDATLLPRVQEQHLREGRREVNRTTRFDFDKRTVTVADGPALPIPAGARDALAAFLYARTLPLTAGYQAAFPVVEGGRQLVATLRVTGEDTAALEGKPTPVWRVEARFDARTSRRPIDATLLISGDARRIPIEIRVDAGFGSFRVELVRYVSR